MHDSAYEEAGSSFHFPAWVLFGGSRCGVVFLVQSSTVRAMTSARRLLLCSVVVVALGGLAFFGSGAGAIFGDSILEWWNRERFDAAAWQSEGSRTDAVRIRMVDDLLRRHRFGGMTREQVTAIVGEPDKTEYFSDWDMVYWLGPERGFVGVDSEWLVFRLDGDKKVSEYEIVRD